MYDIVGKAIGEILVTRKDMLQILLRQRANFEGWLKFELAYKLEAMGMKEVEVEKKADRRRDRTDIHFWTGEQFISVELKTCSTNWKIPGVKDCGRPITDSINGVIADAKKLNSGSGIVAFLMFPIQLGDKGWQSYIMRIAEKTGINISVETHCRTVPMKLNEGQECEILC
jgi:hypothetical protein